MEYYLTIKKGGTSVTCNNMDESQINYVKWEKSDSKNYHLMFKLANFNHIYLYIWIDIYLYISLYI